LLSILTDAYYGVKFESLGLKNFSVDDFIGLLENNSPFRVTDDNPLDIEIFELLSGDLTGVDGVMTHILGGHKHVLVQKGLYRSDVDADRSHDHLKSLLVKLSSIQNIVNEIFHRLDCSIAFPVSTYNVLSLCAFHKFNFILVLDLIYYKAKTFNWN
jgi:hypothetical protein